MNFLDMLNQMIILFLLVLVGYAASRFKIMDEGFNGKLSKLVLNVTCPALVLSSVLGNTDLPGAKEIFSIMLVACISYAMAVVIAVFAPMLLKIPGTQLGTFRFMYAFGNTSFMGFPVVQALFGTNAVFYAAVFNMPFNVLLYMMGVMFLSGENGKFKLSREMVVNPAVITSVAAIILALAKPQAPSVITESLSLLGQITTPAAMLIVGSTLATLDVKEILGGWRLYVMALFRLFVMPGVVWLVMHHFVTDPQTLGIAVVLSGMPVAAACTMLCLEYGGDFKLASQGTFITTLLSVITVPMIVAIFL